VLDAATEGLAPLIVAEIWRVIGEIRKSGIATLIVDRDYRRVLAHADQALVLQKGQVVLPGGGGGCGRQCGAVKLPEGLRGFARNSSDLKVAVALVEYA
jgi:energy-coupling factor transporter ATP-binding protein EcfA2